MSVLSSSAVLSSVFSSMRVVDGWGKGNGRDPAAYGGYCTDSFESPNEPAAGATTVAMSTGILRLYPPYGLFNQVYDGPPLVKAWDVKRAPALHSRPQCPRNENPNERARSVTCRFVTVPDSFSHPHTNLQRTNSLPQRKHLQISSINSVQKMPPPLPPPSHPIYPFFPGDSKRLDPRRSLPPDPATSGDQDEEAYADMFPWEIEEMEGLKRMRAEERAMSSEDHSGRSGGPGGPGGWGGEEWNSVSPPRRGVSGCGRRSGSSRHRPYYNFYGPEHWESLRRGSPASILLTSPRSPTLTSPAVGRVSLGDPQDPPQERLNRSSPASILLTSPCPPTPTSPPVGQVTPARTPLQGMSAASPRPQTRKEVRFTVAEPTAEPPPRGTTPAPCPSRPLPTPTPPSISPTPLSYAPTPILISPPIPRPGTHTLTPTVADCNGKKRQSPTQLRIQANIEALHAKKLELGPDLTLKQHHLDRAR
ncbi:hypothetical protein BDK51DRAFT_42594 [Blyttiomyces helicus]|uniref:Uncharacterized protein n=1 Tax=Blyttiomyces helicus TaxID=388810 RepID=A0A4P9WMD1_9FUNG|nr:hypothetical protein BDK51DRAFT_42594 [Blyttiomyces helicus]|eukprot:RKO93632.1 hypothetical protein BDK51DRAFT_42594 [Blyttiomyces helicus]